MLAVYEGVGVWSVRLWMRVWVCCRVDVVV